MKRLLHTLVLSALLISSTVTAAGTNDWIKSEAGIEISSRKVFYGYALNREPIWIPYASLTFFDTVTPGITAYCDMTDWGSRDRRGSSGYGDRSWRYQEIDPYVKLHRCFDADDASWLPTEIFAGIGYQYEYDPPFPDGRTNPGSHFITGAFALPQLWLEPSLNAEFDVDRDHGIYLNLNIGHSFPLIGDGESPTLALRAEAAQGWGNSDRNEAYSGVDRTGLMDTMFRLTVEWSPYPWLKISPYAAYYEYLFDRHLRDGARTIGYGADRKTESWNFIGGVRFSLSF